MKQSTAKEHRDFFQKNGWIEFEEFLTPEHLREINEAIALILSERAQTPLEKFSILSSETLFLQGRDLWRSNATLRKFVTFMRFAEVVSELIEKRPMRLGYDQLLSIPQSPSNDERQPLNVFLSKTISLQDASCLTDVVCGLMFALKDCPKSDLTDVPEGKILFPTKAGNVIYLKPDLPIPWNTLYAYPGQHFYLIVYTSPFSHYTIQPNDPHTHSLKRLGYVINDKLNDKLHPIIFR